ncbi:MAG TPA: hypothetical protein VFK02_12855 [Kofleriaceae bacterium]|nr:hypothetical protein [Kofleriaceae bacterium]
MTASRALTRPIAIAAIALLVVNDHVLKAAYPGFVTGKLSDFAGMMFAGDDGADAHAAIDATSHVERARAAVAFKTLRHPFSAAWERRASPPDSG